MGRHPIDMVGQKFGKLTVLGPAGKNGKRTTMRWLCQCDCGKPPKAFDGTSLRTGNSTTCGCGRGRKKKKTEPKTPSGVQEFPEVKRTPSCDECGWTPIADDGFPPHYAFCSQYPTDAA